MPVVVALDDSVASLNGAAVPADSVGRLGGGSVSIDALTEAEASALIALEQIRQELRSAAEAGRTPSWEREKLDWVWDWDATGTHPLDPEHGDTTPMTNVATLYGGASGRVLVVDVPAEVSIESGVSLDAVVVSPEAQGASVTVAAGAAVDTLAVGAEDVQVNIGGDVELLAASADACATLSVSLTSENAEINVFNGREADEACALQFEHETTDEIGNHIFTYRDNGRTFIYTWDAAFTSCHAQMVDGSNNVLAEAAQENVNADHQSADCRHSEQLTYIAAFSAPFTAQTITFTFQPALGHDLYTTRAQKPTCTAEGWDAYETCTRCSYTTKVVRKALGHDWSAWETLYAPTCGDTGVETHQCARCGLEENRQLDPDESAHVVGIDPAVPATCTEPGLTEGRWCSQCETVLVMPQVVPALGHTGGTATCLEQAVCTRCGQPYGELGDHTLVEVEPASPADCYNPAMTAYYRCSVCEDYEIPSQSYGEPLGHTFVDGECIRCHMPEFEPVYN